MGLAPCNGIVTRGQATYHLGASDERRVTAQGDINIPATQRIYHPRGRAFITPRGPGARGPGVSGWVPPRPCSTIPGLACPSGGRDTVGEAKECRREIRSGGRL